MNNGFDCEMTIWLHLDIFLALFDLLHICQFLHALEYVIHKISEMSENVVKFELTQLRTASLNVMRNSKQQTFLYSNTMALANEIISHQTFQSIHQRHIFGQSSDEIRQFNFIILRQMSSQ